MQCVGEMEQVCAVCMGNGACVCSVYGKWSMCVQCVGEMEHVCAVCRGNGACVCSV